MTREELDTMWQKALIATVRDGELYTRYRFAALVAKAEREKVAQWMISNGYATGHGDTIEDLLKELEWQLAESKAKAIRARGEV